MTCGRGRGRGRGRKWRGGEGGGRGICRREESFSFLMPHAHPQSFARAVCLIRDMLHTVLFIVTFRCTCCLVFTATIKEYGSDRLPNIIFVQFCEFCSSAAFTVTHSSLRSLSFHRESELDSSLPDSTNISPLFVW